MKTQNETVGTGDSCHVLPAKWDKMPRPHLSCSEFSHSLTGRLSHLIKHEGCIVLTLVEDMSDNQHVVVDVVQKEILVDKRCTVA